jgi:hypothetical protein
MQATSKRSNYLQRTSNASQLLVMHFHRLLTIAARLPFSDWLLVAFFFVRLRTWALLLSMCILSPILARWDLGPVYVSVRSGVLPIAAVFLILNVCEAFFRRVRLSLMLKRAQYLASAVYLGLSAPFCLTMALLSSSRGS